MTIPKVEPPKDYTPGDQNHNEFTDQQYHANRNQLPKGHAFGEGNVPSHLDKRTVRTEPPKVTAYHRRMDAIIAILGSESGNDVYKLMTDSQKIKLYDLIKLQQEALLDRVEAELPKNYLDMGTSQFRDQVINIVNKLRLEL